MWFAKRAKRFVEMEDAELLDSIGRYVRHIEVSPSKQTCKCDVERVPKPEGASETMPQLLRVKDIALDCPVHTKEGFLMGYFDWMRKGK